MKHTKGPWHSKGSVNDAGAIYGNSDEPGPVASAYYRVDREEHNANARLIAAAPELLETMRRVADELSGHIDEDEAEDSLGWCFDKLNEAIAKAEDQEPIRVMANKGTEKV